MRIHVEQIDLDCDGNFYLAGHLETGKISVGDILPDDTEYCIWKSIVHRSLFTGVKTIRLEFAEVEVMSVERSMGDYLSAVFICRPR